MEIKNQKYLVNLSPFIIEAIAYNQNVYDDIDKFYSKHKNEYHKCAISNKYYNHRIIKEKSLIQEEYYRKVLGILSYNDKPKDLDYSKEIHEWFDRILRKGWPYVFTYESSHNIIDLELFTKSYIKKNKGLINIKTTTLNGTNAILLYLCTLDSKDVVKNEYYNMIMQTFLDRLAQGKISYKNSLLSECPSEEIKANLLQLEMRLHSISDRIENLDDICDVAKKFLPTDVVYQILSPYCNISLMDVLDNCNLSKVQIDSILYDYICYKEKVGEKDTIAINDKSFSLFFTFGSIISMLARHYEGMKEYHNKNSNESLTYEVDELKNKIEKSQNEITRLKNENEELKAAISEKNKEIERLKNKIDEDCSDKEELYRLREIAFNLNNTDVEEQPQCNYDLNRLKNVHGMVVGGDPKWQKRMKEKLPNFIYVSVDDINFDTNIINNADFICINIKYLSHALYYKIINNVRKLNKGIIYFPPNVNIELDIRAIYKAVFQDKKVA